MANIKFPTGTTKTTLVDNDKFLFSDSELATLDVKDSTYGQLKTQIAEYVENTSNYFIQKQIDAIQIDNTASAENGFFGGIFVVLTYEATEDIELTSLFIKPFSSMTAASINIDVFKNVTASDVLAATLTQTALDSPFQRETATMTPDAQQEITFTTPISLSSGEHMIIVFYHTTGNIEDKNPLAFTIVEDAYATYDLYNVAESGTTIVIEDGNIMAEYYFKLLAISQLSKVE